MYNYILRLGKRSDRILNVGEDRCNAMITLLAEGDNITFFSSNCKTMHSTVARVCNVKCTCNILQLGEGFTASFRLCHKFYL